MKILLYILINLIILYQYVESYDLKYFKGRLHKKLIVQVNTISSTNNNDNVNLNVDNNVKEKYDGIFGSELIFPKDIEIEGRDYYIKNGKRYKIIPLDKRNEVMEPFYQLRLKLLVDNLYICAIGVCIVWYFGTITDVYSYSVGGILGVLYSVLLGRYVESIGGNGQTNSSGGNARFVPVILLIVLYSKFKDQLSILPELAGFFSYKISPFLQIFYKEETNDNEIK